MYAVTLTYNLIHEASILSVKTETSTADLSKTAQRILGHAWISFSFGEKNQEEGEEK